MTRGRRKGEDERGVEKSAQAVNIRLTHFPLQKIRYFPEKAGIK
jgi:hypothetical protein